MVIDIHKAVISNPISRNLLKPWGSFAKPNSLRSKLFNKYTDPGNPIEKQVDFHPYTGQIYKVHDPPLSNNDRCSMFHDIAYTVAQNVKKNPKDVKNRKLEADDKWLKCFKVRTPYDALAYSAIKTKKTLGFGNNFSMEDLSQELNKPTINKFERKKIIVNHINEIHSTDLVDMSQYSKINKGYKYIFTNIDVFSKIAYAFPLKSKKIHDIKACFEKIFNNNNKPKFIWSDKEPAFLSKEMQQFFKDNNVKIYHTNSHLKAVVIERFNRSLRELMMKEFVKNNNTVWYNILPKLIKIYNNRYHNTIKMKPIQVNKSNEKYIKENIYSYNKTSKIPKFKINDLVRISLKRRDLFDKPTANIKWSEELFKIHSINKSNVITYKIKDLNNEIIDGIFYEKELQKTKNTGVYIIEKIIQKNKNKYLVKWRNYSDDFNSWIDKDDIIKYT